MVFQQLGQYYLHDVFLTLLMHDVQPLMVIRIRDVGRERLECGSTKYWTVGLSEGSPPRQERTIGTVSVEPMRGTSVGTLQFAGPLLFFAS